MKDVAMLIALFGSACVFVAQVVDAYGDRRTGWPRGVTQGMFAGGMLMMLYGLVMMLVALVWELV